MVIEDNLTFCSLIIFLLRIHMLELLRVSSLSVAWISLSAQKAITPFILGYRCCWQGMKFRLAVLNDLEVQTSAEISWLVLGRGI